jgi:hypothetical protein
MDTLDFDAMIDFDFLPVKTPRSEPPTEPPTMLLDFDSIPVTKIVEVNADVINETVIATPSKAKTYLATEEDYWGWKELRDFVVAEIEKYHGPQPRDFTKEASIFKSFMTRYPDNAVSIAKFAFGPVAKGMWRGAPISVTRFCKASDPYFSDVIIASL